MNTKLTSLSLQYIDENKCSKESFEELSKLVSLKSLDLPGLPFNLLEILTSKIGENLKYLNTIGGRRTADEIVDLIGDCKNLTKLKIGESRNLRMKELVEKLQKIQSSVTNLTLDGHLERKEMEELVKLFPNLIKLNLDNDGRYPIETEPLVKLKSLEKLTLCCSTIDVSGLMSSHIVKLKLINCHDFQNEIQNGILKKMCKLGLKYFEYRTGELKNETIIELKEVISRFQLKVDFHDFDINFLFEKHLLGC